MYCIDMCVLYCVCVYCVTSQSVFQAVDWQKDPHTERCGRGGFQNVLLQSIWVESHRPYMGFDTFKKEVHLFIDNSLNKFNVLENECQVNVTQKDNALIEQSIKLYLYSSFLTRMQYNLTPLHRGVDDN